MAQVRTCRSAVPALPGIGGSRRDLDCHWRLWACRCTSWILEAGVTSSPSVCLWVLPSACHLAAFRYAVLVKEKKMARSGLNTGMDSVLRGNPAWAYGLSRGRSRFDADPLVPGEPDPGWG